MIYGNTRLYLKSLLTALTQRSSCGTKKWQLSPRKHLADRSQLPAPATACLHHEDPAPGVEVCIPLNKEGEWGAGKRWYYRKYCSNHTGQRHRMPVHLPPEESHSNHQNTLHTTARLPSSQYNGTFQHRFWINPGRGVMKVTTITELKEVNPCWKSYSVSSKSSRWHSCSETCLF